MSDFEDNGGSAFPVFTNQYHWGYEKEVPSTVSPGMTLRDYFAAKAMQGLMANPGVAIQANGMQGWNYCNCTPENVAQVAYGMADAMLEARDK